MNNSISAIVVTYNPDEHEIINILTAISKQVTNLILIDNNSANLKRFINNMNIHNINVTLETSNQGLAVAHNKGIKIAKELKSTHVIIFDQDSLIEEGFVNGLIATEQELINSGEKVAAVGPTFYDPNTNVDYPATLYFGPFIQRKNKFKTLAASYIISSGSLIRLCVIDEVGLMNSDFFIDYIDVEWCFRARSIGYNVFITKSSKMKHTIGDRRVNFLGRIISIHSPLRRYYLVRNSILMMRLPYVSTGYKLREFSLNIFRFILGLICSKEKLNYCHYAFRGIIDGLSGKKGKIVESYKAEY